jgi:uncharacterized membrane protein (Fun14 family)
MSNILEEALRDSLRQTRSIKDTLILCVQGTTHLSIIGILNKGIIKVNKEAISICILLLIGLD